MINIKRVKVDQPSTFQKLHKYHGMKGLAIVEKDLNFIRVYFYEGETVSMIFNSNQLSFY